MTELPDYADLPPAPQGGRSGWGLFGAGDNLGLVNLMTPERIAAAARLVRRGQVFCLDMRALSRTGSGSAGAARRARIRH